MINTGGEPFYSSVQASIAPFGGILGSERGGQHNRGSLHYSGNAVDIPMGASASPQAKANADRMRADLESRGFKVRDERTHPQGQAVWGGPHLHVERMMQAQPMNAPSASSPDMMVGRSPEEQQLLTERAKNQAAREQMPVEAQQAGNVAASTAIAKARAESSTAGMTATTAGTMEASKTQAQEAGKTYAGIQSKAQMARTENNNLQLMRTNLQNTYTGPGADAVLGAKRVASAMGFDVKGMGEAEAARALANKMALAMRNPAGGEGMPGAMSDADRNFLVQSTANLGSSPAGWKALINMRLALNQTAMDQAKYAERLRMSGTPIQDIPGKLQDYADAHPVFHPKQAPKPASNGGWGIQKVGH